VVPVSVMGPDSDTALNPSKIKKVSCLIFSSVKYNMSI
jgi:hypothetical protein